MSHASAMPSTWSVASEIIKEGGFGRTGLSKGLMATVARHSYWNMVYFAFYHSVKGYVPEPKVNLLSNFFLIITVSVQFCQLK